MVTGISCQSGSNWPVNSFNAGGEQGYEEMLFMKCKDFTLQPQSIVHSGGKQNKLLNMSLAYGHVKGEAVMTA